MLRSEIILAVDFLIRKLFHECIHRYQPLHVKIQLIDNAVIGNWSYDNIVLMYRLLTCFSVLQDEQCPFFADLFKNLYAHLLTF